MFKSTQSTAWRTIYLRYLQKKIPFMYPNYLHIIKLLQRKATSKSTAAFLEKTTIDTSIKYTGCNQKSNQTNVSELHLESKNKNYTLSMS